MEAIEVVCPSGLFPLPTPCNIRGTSLSPAGLVHSSSHAGAAAAEIQYQLLEHLQGFRDHAHKLLALASVQRAQGTACYDLELQKLMSDASACVQQALQQAAAAKQPLLLTSSQHTSCFCHLFEQLHLLDMLRAAIAKEAQAQQQLAEQQKQQDEQQQWCQLPSLASHLAGSFLSRLEEQLQAVPGIDAVLAALVMFCQQIQAAASKLTVSSAASAGTGSGSVGSGGKAEAIDVSCLSSVQEQHTAARAMPLLLRLYFNNISRAETLAAGKPELLTTKHLERCLALLAAKPVVPGYADMHVSLTSELETCQPLQELLAARKLKLLPAAPWQLDGKSVAKLNQSYNLQPKVLPLLQQHDELCDLLSQLALEVKQAMAVDRDIEVQAFINADKLVDGSISFVHAAKNALLDLDAWRLSQDNGGRLRKRQQQQQVADDTAEPCDRFVLQPEDVVAFMDVLGAAKGLTGLLTDSCSWLEQLLQVHTIKQLQAFAAGLLPTLAKQYARNSRVQSLLRSIYASMQGQLVELKDDTYAPSYATSAAGDAPEAVLVFTEADGQHRQQSLRSQSGPLAEGFEGLMGRFGSKRSPAKATQQQQQDENAEEHVAAADEEQEVMAAAAAIAAAISAGAATAATRHSGTSDSSHQEQQLERAEALGSVAQASSSAVGAAAVGVMADGACEQQGSAAALAAYAAETAAAAAVHPAKGNKRKFGKGLMRSIVSGKGKSKPEPSPQPQLCSAPAALAAHAALDAMLSEAEAEVAASEHEAAAAAAPRAMLGGCASGSSSLSYAAGQAEARQQQGSGRLMLQMGHKGLHMQAGDDESASSKADDEGNDTSGFSSMCSLSAAFQRPPDLPWEASPQEGQNTAAAAARVLDGAAEYSPRSVAVAAAHFESRIAQHTSRRSSRLSSTQVPAGFGATTPPRVSLPQSPRLLAEEELGLEDGAGFELAEEPGGAALEASHPVQRSPRSARRFHFFKFRSILQHHEKLSTQALAEAAAAAAALEAAAANEGDGDDAAVSGTSARIRAVLSMRRRTTAASAVTAAAAAAADGEVAVSPDEAGTHADGEVACPAADADAAMDAALSGVSPRTLHCGATIDAADVPASTPGIVDVPDQPSKQRRIGGLMSRAASRMMNLSSRASKEPAVAAGPGVGVNSSHQARQSFKGLTFTAKLKKAMVDRRGTAEVAIDGTVLSALQLESVPPLACLLQLRALLEQLMHEIKTETKKHLMMQLQMAAAAAAGGGSAQPDASIARPLRQVKAMIKAVYRMELALDFPRQLAAAADMSGLWLSRAYSSFFAAEQQQVQQLRSPSAAGLVTGMATEQLQQEGVEGSKLYNLLFDDEQSEGSSGSGSHTSAAQQRANANRSPTASPFADASCQDTAAGTIPATSRSAGLASFPAALLAGCMRQLQRLPAELPLLVLHLFWDARELLQHCGLLPQGLQLLRQQEEACMCCYVQHLVPAAYEHFKRVAAHHTVTYELLSSCNAPALQPVQPLLFDALLREPCPVVLQGDYTSVACKAEGQLAAPGGVPGSMLLQSLSGRPAGNAVANGSQQQQLAAKQLQVIHELQQALQALQQQQQQQQEAEDQQVQQQQPPTNNQQVSKAPSPGPGYGGKSLPASQAVSPEKVSAATPEAAQQKKRKGHRSKRRAAAAQSAAEDAVTPAAVAGQTPLMQRLEQLKLAQHLMQAQQRQAAQALVAAESCSVLDVRQWLLAGLLASLKRDAAAVVARSRVLSPNTVVEVQVQAAILQRTHQLLSQYAPLPCSWPQLWGKADAIGAASSSDGSSCDSTCARAVAGGVLSMLNTAVYDSEALMLLPAAAAAPAAAGSPAAAGVLGEVSAALRPLSGFFGRQHLQALLGLAGPAGQAHLLEGLMDKLDEEQGFLLDQLQVIQQQLPPALLQLPPAERCHTAGAVLQFYQQQLSSALGDPQGACPAALACLQRIGNCLALLHLLTMQQSVQATPAFMHAAPLLGIISRPLTDAAAAAECFEYDGAPDPPTLQTAGGFAGRSCAAGLLMPEVEQLLPSDSARHVHEVQAQKELQQEQAWQQLAAQQGQPFDASLIKPGGELSRHRIWQASHFQRLLLGPDAEKVRGPALLLTQTAELRAWRATQAQECMGPCMARLRRWAFVLQWRLEGLAGIADASEEDVVQLAAAATGVHAGIDASAAAGQQQNLSSLAGGLPEEPAVRASLAGEIAAGEVAGIGMRENTLYGATMTPPDSPYKEQQHQIAGPDQQHEPAADGLGQAEDAAQQQQAAAEHKAALAGDTSQQQQQYNCSEASLSLAGSCITAKPSSHCSLGGAGSQPHISYDNSQPQLTPLALQLDPLSTGVSAVAMDAATAAGGVTMKANSSPATGFLTSEELHAAAAAAAVAAASLPSSPRAGAAAAAAAAGVSVWEVAGAAAAQLPAGSIAPAHAKLAYKALLDSSPQQQDGGLTAGAAGAHHGSGTYGLAELVGEVSDALSTARSDAGAALGLQSALSSRQVLLQVAEGQQEQQAASNAAGAGAEAEEMQQQTAGDGAGAWSGYSSPCSSPRGMRRSSIPGAPDAADGSQGDTASNSGVEPEGCQRSGQQPSSRLRHRSSGGAPSLAAVAATGAGSAAEAAMAGAGDGVSPSRAVVPRLGLEALSSAQPAMDTATGAAALSSRSGPASSRTASSEARQASRQQLNSAPSRQNSSRQRAGQPQRQQADSSEADEASKTSRESVVDGSYPAPDVDDLLFESTCCELVRVKDENNVLRDELEMLRNQLQNRDTSLALLSGNLFTPRPSERGSSGEQRTVPAAVPEELPPAPAGERPARSRAGTPRTLLASSAAAAVQPDAATAVTGGSNTTKESHAESADGSADVTVSSGGAAESARKVLGAPSACPAAAVAAAASPGGRSSEAAKLQPHGLGLSAGLIKGSPGLGLSPEPSDLKIESSKISVRAQQPSPLPHALSACDDDSGSSNNDSGSSSDDSSSTADGGSDAKLPGVSATRKLQLPTALPSASGIGGCNHAAQLAVVMSALKFALLLDVAKGRAGGAAGVPATGVGSSSCATEQVSAARTPQASPLKRLMRAASTTMTGGADAGSTAAALEQLVKPGGIAGADVGAASATAGDGEGATAGRRGTQAAALDRVPAGAVDGKGTATLQHPSGSGRIAGGGYGDGPLLASAVLLQLTGQTRKHALLDATSRIAHWVEYDAVKVSGAAAVDGLLEAGAAAAAAGGAADGSGAAVPQLPGGLQTPGGIVAPAASSVAAPKPRSKKWQEEEAEEAAKMRQRQAAEQLLLQRLAAAARQADRVATDGAGLAERFAPPAPAHKQRVRVKVRRVDKVALLAPREASATWAQAGAGTAAELGNGSRFSSMGGAGASAGYSQPGTPPVPEHAVLAVPVRQEVLIFGPRVRPWAGLTPSQRPIQGHPSLPMQRPRPLLLPAAGGTAGAPQAAGAGGIVGPAGRLLPGVGVGANAGLVAAARAVHAKEALLAAMPRTAVYSFSVMSDHNRSGRMDDGYSKAPSTADLDNLEDISPRKGRHASAAAAAAAARLGGMHAAGMADQTGCYSASEASSPSKSPTRSPTKRSQAAAHASGLLASIVG